MADSQQLRVKLVKKQAIRLVLVMASTYPSLSSALSLGEIQFNSQVNQPFKARIELLQATEQELAKLQVHVAPPSLFAQAQLARPQFMDSLKFARSIKQGRNYLLISSTQAITEPEFNLLLELTSPKGQLLKRYSIALAEPRSEPRSTVAEAQPQPLTAPIASLKVEPESLASAALVEAVESESLPQATAAIKATQKPSRQAHSARSSGSEPVKSKLLMPKVAIPLPPLAFKYRYRVRKTDTIFTIAERLNLSSLSLDEKVLALYARNPHAFIKGDLHQLKRGAVLKTPTAVRRKPILEAPVQIASLPSVPKPAAPVPTQPTLNLAKNLVKSTSTTETRLAIDPPLAQVLKTQELASGLILRDLQERLNQAQSLLAKGVHENTELKELVQEKNRLLTRREQELAALQTEMTQVQTKTAEGAAGAKGVPRLALMELEQPVVNLENTWQGVFTSPLVWKMTALSSLFLVLVALWQKRRSDDQFMQLSVQNAILLPDAYVDEDDTTGDLDFLWAEDELDFAHEQLISLRHSMASLREKNQRLQAYLQLEPLSTAL